VSDDDTCFNASFKLASLAAAADAAAADAAAAADNKSVAIASKMHVSQGFISSLCTVSFGLFCSVVEGCHELQQDGVLLG